MRRYFSHYTYIHPDIYLKNHIVELDEEFHIIRFFPFKKEIEKTEFHSGLLVFIPKENGNIEEVLNQVNEDSFNNKILENSKFSSTEIYTIYRK